MAEESTEICGFLDVKYLGGKCKVHKVKKRTLAPWKVWKRHWCSIKKLGPGLGVKVQLDYGIGNGSSASPNDRDNSVIIPLDALICRTQSRSKQFAFGIFPTKERKPLLYLAGASEIESQRWMSRIRYMLKSRKHRFAQGSYSISMVDNGHSKSSGLTGLYGDLVASTIGIFIKDVHSGDIIQSFEWREFSQFHLSTAGRSEDVKCICVMHTTKEFHGGLGELHVFCLEAGKLLQDLVTQGRGPKIRPVSRRPLSLSEGDLRMLTREEVARKCPMLYKKTDFRALNTRKENNIGYEETRCRIHNKIPEHFYQPEPNSVPNVSGCFKDAPCSHNRRVSDISIASGIYEEILDQEDSNKAATSQFYMDQYYQNRQLDEPPPLPPRQRCASESMKSIRSHNVFTSPRSIIPTSSRTPVRNEANVFPLDKSMDHSIYVPMSPQLKDITLHNLQKQASLQENDYVIMR